MKYVGRKWWQHEIRLILATRQALFCLLPPVTKLAGALLECIKIDLQWAVISAVTPYPPFKWLLYTQTKKSIPIKLQRICSLFFMQARMLMLPIITVCARDIFTFSLQEIISRRCVSSVGCRLPRFIMYWHVHQPWAATTFVLLLVTILVHHLYPQKCN